MLISAVRELTVVQSSRKRMSCTHAPSVHNGIPVRWQITTYHLHRPIITDSITVNSGMTVVLLAHTELPALYESHATGAYNAFPLQRAKHTPQERLWRAGGTIVYRPVRDAIHYKIGLLTVSCSSPCVPGR
jgi:hypothetical protein